MNEIVRIEGLEEIARQLNAIGKAGNKIARNAIVSGTKIIQEEITRRVPIGKTNRQFGRRNKLGMHLRDSIRSSVRETQRGWMSAVGPGKISRAQQLKRMRGVSKTGKTKEQLGAEFGWELPRYDIIAWWLEYGTKPHHLGSKSRRRTMGGKASKTTGIRPGWWRYRGKVHELAERRRGAMHPGTRPNDFMSKSFDASKDRALKAITETLRRELIQ